MEALSFVSKDNESNQNLLAFNRQVKDSKKEAVDNYLAEIHRPFIPPSYTSFLILPGASSLRCCADADGPRPTGLGEHPDGWSNRQQCWRRKRYPQALPVSCWSR